MKIIKPGVRREDQKFGGTCLHCGCVVECSGTEYTIGPNYRSLFVKCPTCTTNIIVERKDNNPQLLNG